MAAREAIEEAYKAGLVQRSFVPVTSQNILDKIAACQPLDSDEYHAMLEEIRKELNFTSLHYHRLDDMIEAVGIEPCRLCTYCWSGRE